jgi:hypothetical protein
LPDYRYDGGAVRFTDSAIAVADAIQPQTWLDEFEPSADRIHDAYHIGRPISLEEFVPRSSNVREVLQRPVQRKPFHFTQASLTVEHIRLEQVGLSIYDTGNLFASGKMTHDGGPDGGLQGSNVLIHLRAYAAPVKQLGQLPINSAVVWQSSHRVWVHRGPSQVVSLTCFGGLRDPGIRRHFNEITHLQVELEYQPDR